MRKLILFFACLSLALAGSDDFFEDEYSAPEKRFDPLSGYNRLMTGFNDFVYVNAFNPVVKGYKTVMPVEIRGCVNNFFDNLGAPMRFLNNLLQGKFKNSGEELFRFVVNTTMGVGGVGDAGEKIFGVKKHSEDFGQTLGHYGVGSGFPIVWPFLGPSNLRDSVGLVGDYFSYPVNYLKNKELSFGLNVYNKANQLSFHEGEYENLRQNALDLYPYLQDMYERHRENEIKK